jgi:DNA polymerase-3 subunit alpha
MKSGGNGTANSLFGDTVQVVVKKPQPKNCEEWSDIVRLNKEKELVGIYLSAHPLDQYKLEINNYCNATMAEMAANDDSLKSKNELRLAGIVTGAAERTTKTGNPWGQLTVEDFSGSYQFALFSKDYMQFKSFFTTGYSVLIRGKMQPKYNNPAEMDFRIQSIEFLSDMKDKMLNSITLSLPVNEINTNVMDLLHKISSSNKGHSTLAFNIFDPKTNVKIRMHSRSCRVKIDNALISELNRQNITYEIK